MDEDISIFEVGIDGAGFDDIELISLTFEIGERCEFFNNEVESFAFVEEVSIVVIAADVVILLTEVVTIFVPFIVGVEERDGIVVVSVALVKSVGILVESGL
jgi:hypothetical protein